MRHSFGLLVVAVAPLLLAGCDESTTPLQSIVSMRDNCEPTSFNAALGPGTCVRAGTTTFAQFSAELQANKSVAAWLFVPAALTARVGEVIQARNDGGEVHTFTEVKQFGGGFVPALNTASGNTVVAPECMGLPASALVQAGATFAAKPETTVGTDRFQCCVHPWMRATVTVTAQ